MNTPLVLIGLLGSGKSSVGKKLAKELNLKFCDADVLFEERAGQSIVSFFAEHGEKNFRVLESEILLDLIKKDAQVIATGGGVILNAHNRDLIQQASLCIYLDADIETLSHRLEHDESRPLLQNTDLRRRLEELQKQRASYYQECAHITVAIKEKSIEQIVEEIVEQLEQVNYCR